MRDISIVIGMLGLTYFGFEYDSNWAFTGAVVLFFAP